MKITTSCRDCFLAETPEEVTVVTFVNASGKIYPSVYLDYERGKESIARFLRERRKRGEHWRTIEWHGAWASDKGEKLDRMIIDESLANPGVYE